MNFNSSIPIYLQLIAMIKLQIAAGRLKPGEKLPSVRDLALYYEVNPNTMQKALSELEREELLYSQRTSGRFVTEDEELIKKLRDELAKTQVDELIGALKSMGYTDQEIIDLIKSYLEGMQS